MGQALADVLPLAVAIAIFPVPIIAAVVLVGSERGVAKGVAFVLAWCAGLVAVGLVVLLIAEAADATDGDERSTWVNVLLLCLGLLALAAAAKQWRARPSAGEEGPPPGWMRTVDEFTTARAGAAGLALTALNPKNLLLTVGAAAEIAGAGLSAGQQAAVLLTFVLVASLGVLIPVALAVALGAGSRRLLDGLRAWMARHNAVIMTALLLLIGAKLLVDAVSGFAD